MFTLRRHFSISTEEAEMNRENPDAAVDNSATVCRETITVESADDDFQPIEITSILHADSDLQLEMHVDSIADDLSEANDVDGVESLGDEQEQEQEEEGEEEAEDEMEEDEEEELPTLPPHVRCACHTLQLVATTDIKNALSGQLQKTSVQTFAKLSALWNKQNRSSTAADAISDALGRLLVTPGETRWNSYYDALSVVNTILKSTERAPKFDALCEQLGIKRLIASQKRFISEYVQVFKPICCGLDVLQGDVNVTYGYLIPTLHVIINELDELLLPTESNEAKLTLCEPLVHALKKGIQTRFRDVMADNSALLAAVVHPKFKLDWLDDPAEKSRLIALLKTRAAAVTKRVDGGTQPAIPASSSASQIQESILSPRSTDENQDFFSTIAARRRQHAFQPESTIWAEIDRFLTHHEPYPTGKVLNVKMALAAFPTIRQMFVDLNTGLPASAAVERLFSLGGRVFTPLRARMTSHHFEMMMFLRLAKNF